MSTRPVSPPSVAHWKFRLGAGVLFAAGMTAVLLGSWPPEALTLLLGLVSLALSVGLVMAPFLMEYEARVRLAEAQARDHIETQIRRLVQTTEQLGNAISRSQSTEEQAGQALGTLEELTEKVSAQAEELAQNLARSHERELASLRDDVARLLRERDDRFAGLDQRLDATAAQLAENQLATKKTAAGSAKALDEIKERMIAVAARLDELAQASRSAITVTTPPVLETVATLAAAIETSSAATVAPVTPQIAAAAVETPPPAPTETPPSAASVKESAPPAAHDQTPAAARPNNGAEAHAPAAPAAVAASPAPTAAAAAPAPHAKPRVRRAPEPATATVAAAPAPVTAPARISAKPQTLDLPLLDLPEPRPVSRRDHNTAASTLVATAYIGIGNKLYVRGDGPGLNWDRGVPMQFLAIGKWGWTSPDAAEPITCRIYRNDDTPMLDENIVIAPGAKAEITPRF